MIIGRERLALENQLTMMSVMRRWSDDQENRGHVASLTERMEETRKALDLPKSQKETPK